jgi:hypothetical protein
VGPTIAGRGGYLQPHGLIMLILLLLEAAVEIVGDDGLNADPIFAVERVVLAVAVLVHVVGAHVAANFGVFVQPF